MLGDYWLQYLDVTRAYGPNQFAYTTKRGCKDLLLSNLLEWTWNLHRDRKVALYCSDVKGAFDRVDTERLLQKLRQKGLSGKLLTVLGSWLEQRAAKVVVELFHSESAELSNSVYQGTVWGPPLWNVFFEDARVPVNQAGFSEALFADDLNAYKCYNKSCQNGVLYEEMQDCQARLHNWGKANKVQFDAGKESMHILHRTEPDGEAFEMFGVKFDTKLTMEKQIQSLVSPCKWKLKTLLRAKRYFNEEQLVKQYKTHILPYLEFATPAVYHATATALEPLDKLQATFLREVGLTPLEALKKYNLAPLETRRDIALLGVVHRTVLGEGPPQFRRWFFAAEGSSHEYNTRRQEARRKYGKQLHDYLDRDQSALLRRSPLGLTRVYNELDAEAVKCTTVKSFQAELQRLVRKQAEAGVENWERHLKVKPALK